MSAPARELARRMSGTDEVLLLWRAETGRVELCIRDATSGATVQVDVAPRRALDAFHHPYVYAYAAGL